MSTPKFFVDGQRVRYTAAATDAGLVKPGKPVTGVVVGRSQRTDRVRVRLDGESVVARYHVDFFEPIDTAKRSSRKPASGSRP